MAVKDVVEGIAGTIIAGGGIWVGIKTYTYSKKRDSKGDTKVAIKEAVADENRITKIESALEAHGESLDFIVRQLGKNPNGGNAMQQIIEGTQANNQKIDDFRNETSSLFLDLSKHILGVGADLRTHLVNHREKL